MLDEANVHEAQLARAQHVLRLIPRLHRWAASRVLELPQGPDLSLQQLAVLHVICLEAIAPGELARCMGVTPAVVTGIADRLERRGLIQREPDRGDRRRLHLVITERGRAVTAAVEQALAIELAARLPTSLAALAELERALTILDQGLDQSDWLNPGADPGAPPPDPIQVVTKSLARDTMAAAPRRRDAPPDNLLPRSATSNGIANIGESDIGSTRRDQIVATVTKATSPVDEVTIFDLQDPHFRANAFETYADLREQGPVARIKFVIGGEGDEGSDARGFANQELFLVTRYEEAVAALLDDRLSVDPRSAMTPEQLEQMPPTPEEFRPLSRSILTVDPPDHTRLRKLVQPSFTGRAMDALRPRIQEIADELIDEAERAAAERGEQAPDRAMNLIDAFAYPLPMTVISEMLGVPEADRDQIRRWSEALLGGRAARGDEEARQQLRDFIAYLRDLFEIKRQSPTADIISELVYAEEDGERLDEDELLSMIFILIIAGHVTTVNLIGSAVYGLLTHPDQLARLQADPELAKQAVEETLRFWGPAETTTPRCAKEDIELGGTLIRQGERVMVGLASADRDPARFPHGDEFNIDRPEANRHIAFGKGVHVCLGAPLARAEGYIALTTLFRRLPNLRLAVPADEVSWHLGFLRGVESLPVRF